VVNLIAGSLGIINRNAVKIPANQKLLDVKVYDAVFWYYYLVREMDEQIFAKAVSSMREAVKLDPNYALGWAVLAETCVAGHFYGFPCGPGNALDEAVSSGKIALKLDKQCHHAYQSLALAYVFRHEKENCLAIARDWLSLNANVAGISGGIGFCLICCGEYEQGYRMIMDSIQLNPYYPWWFNAGISIYHLKNGEYDDAVYWADKLQDYTRIWELLLKMTAHAEAGHAAEAEKARQLLAGLLPEEQLYKQVHAFIHDEQLTGTIIRQVDSNRLTT
jgi:Tfp pilus assembly protein PilF